MSRLDLAVDQIAFARKYTLRLLEDVAETEWVRQPTEGVTHIGWQVGHLAMAQYWLALNRIRGKQPGDESLISEEFMSRFERSSTPTPDPANYPSPAEIRTVLDRVHQQTLHELKTLREEELDKPTLRPHPLFTTKGGALIWCAQHELVHAGQIGLLRRLLGHKPLW